jgi:hypothetical protein
VRVLRDAPLPDPASEDGARLAALVEKVNGLVDGITDSLRDLLSRGGRRTVQSMQLLDRWADGVGGGAGWSAGAGGAGCMQMLADGCL